MARTDPQVNLRLPADLKERLEAAAAATGRSLTAEVVWRLQETFEADDADPLSEAELDVRLRELGEQLRHVELVQRRILEHHEGRVQDPASTKPARKSKR